MGLQFFPRSCCECASVRMSGWSRSPWGELLDIGERMSFANYEFILRKTAVSQRESRSAALTEFTCEPFMHSVRKERSFERA